MVTTTQRRPGCAWLRLVSSIGTDQGNQKARLCTMPISGTMNALFPFRTVLGL